MLYHLNKSVGYERCNIIYVGFHWRTGSTADLVQKLSANKSLCFLGDPPPDPRFLASLGALSLVKLHHCLDRTNVCSFPPGSVRSLKLQMLTLPTYERLDQARLSPDDNEDEGSPWMKVY